MFIFPSPQPRARIIANFKAEIEIRELRSERELRVRDMRNIGRTISSQVEQPAVRLGAGGHREAAAG